MEQKNFLTFILFLLLPVNAFAHVGEHVSGRIELLFHFIFHPVHLPVAVLSIIVTTVIISRLRKRHNDEL